MRKSFPKKKQKMLILKSMPKSVGTLAEEILNQDFAQIQEGKISVPDMELPQALEEQRDISNIDVPSDFMSSILGESKKEVVEDSLKEPKTTQQDIQEYDILGRKKTKVLLDKFDSLIKEARSVIDELTSVGMLGTTSADPKAKKKVANQTLGRYVTALQDLRKQKSSKGA